MSLTSLDSSLRALRRVVGLVLVASLVAWLGLASAGCSSSSSDTPSDGDAAVGDDVPGDDGGGADAGPIAYPAFPIKPPQLINRGGDVMANPTIVPVFYPEDTSSAKVVSFLKDVSVKNALDTAVAEYGIGASTVGDSVTQPSAAPTSVTDADIRSELQTDTKNFPGGINNLYVFFMPSTSVKFSRGPTTLCQQVGGYHDAFQRSDGTPVVYAIIPRCQKFAFFFDFDAVTTTTIHEIAEAVTDPLSSLKKPAWLIVDSDHAGYGLVFSGFNNVANEENGDLCTPTSSLDVVKLGTYALPLLWSNKSALAGHDPCTGPGKRPPYFNLQPVIKSTTVVSLQDYGSVGLPTSLNLPAVIAHAGESTDVTLQAFSDAPTSGPWDVQGGDLTKPNTPILTVKLDKPKVTNGDTVTATIVVPSNASHEVYLVGILSKLDVTIKYTGFLVRVL